VTEAQVEKLLALAAKSTQASFMQATGGLGVTRDISLVLWRCARLMKKATRLKTLAEKAQDASLARLE
jgi:hypothetical protein